MSDALVAAGLLIGAEAAGVTNFRGAARAASSGGSAPVINVPDGGVSAGEIAALIPDPPRQISPAEIAALIPQPDGPSTADLLALANVPTQDDLHQMGRDIVDEQRREASDGFDDSTGGSWITEWLEQRNAPQDDETTETVETADEGRSWWYEAGYTAGSAPVDLGTGAIDAVGDGMNYGWDQGEAFADRLKSEANAAADQLREDYTGAGDSIRDTVTRVRTQASEIDDQTLGSDPITGIFSTITDRDDTGDSGDSSGSSWDFSGFDSGTAAAPDEEDEPPARPTGRVF